MNSRERLELSLNHKEPDMIPIDIGASLITGINKMAYNKLIEYLGMEKEENPMFDVVQQLVTPSRSFLEKFEIDVWNVSPSNPRNWRLEIKQEGDYNTFVDDWGIKWKMPVEGGHYFDMATHPLEDAQRKTDVLRHRFPDALDDVRYTGMRERAQKLYDAGKGILVSSISAGIFELGTWLMGYESFLSDLAFGGEAALKVLDKALDIKLQYWDRVLDETGDLIQVVQEADDLGTQNSLIISPSLYRKYIKPLHKELFSFIHSKTKAKIFLHCCGSIIDLIPDLIEVGLDIINPVQFNAARMDAANLKKTFGKDLTFWGGGVDTQKILPFGTPQEVSDNVKRQIEILAPGGGFVFNTVHNIQSDVPPENLMAMFETFKQYRMYKA
ncbi:MAG: uroporphyrinogen decarboxylase family protein [Acetivibrionales bacterium]|jgi:uroporphyrinogen decarboxylase